MDAHNRVLSAKITVESSLKYDTDSVWFAKSIAYEVVAYSTLHAIREKIRGSDTRCLPISRFSKKPTHSIQLNLAFLRENYKLRVTSLRCPEVCTATIHTHGISI